MDNMKGKCQMEEIIKKTMQAVEKNRMNAFYAEKKEDVVPLVESLLEEGCSVAVGGSMSLFECGVIEHLRSGRYNFIDRYKEGLSREEVGKIYREAFFADAYLCSSNAVTEEGELYNVDGNANRIAAIAFGPEKVIMVVGKNKIVKDINEAVLRVKNIASPKNCVRLSCETYCREKGHCMVNDASYDGCTSDGRICCTRLICDMQRVKGRINVIFVGEDVGY